MTLAKPSRSAQKYFHYAVVTPISLEHPFNPVALSISDEPLDPY